MNRKKKLRKWYDKEPVNKDRIGTFSIEFKGISDSLRSIAVPRMKALDVACGSGNYTFLLSSLELHVTAVDISKVSLAYLKKDSRFDKHSIIPRRINDARELPFPDKMFQFVTCIGMLEYYPWKDKQIFLQEMCRVLDIHGWLLFDIPLSGHPKTIEFTRMEQGIGNTIFPESSKAIKNILEALGLSLKNIKIAGFMQQFLVQKESEKKEQAIHSPL